MKNIHPQKCWKQMRQLKKKELKKPYIINGKDSKEDITNEFADHFNSLLNHPTVKKDHETKELPEPSASESEFTINTEDITTAISYLKINKCPDPFSLLAEHIKFAGNETLIHWLKEFYNKIFLKSTVPDGMSTSTIHPLVKSFKKSLRSSNNYRGISIIPIITKLLEYIILIKCPEIAGGHDFQFGYKEHSSTLHAEFLIAETIRYYNNNNSPVYICGLDAEKAFDSCNWDILFEKLHYEKGLPLSVTKVIKSLYTKSTAKVTYNGHTSKEFSLSQGVRQGSILSPYLYNIYTENLLKTLEISATTGTTLYDRYTGIVMYADDIILMSPTRSGLQKLANTCIEVSKINCINFNPDKTEFVISGKTHTSQNTIEINGYYIEPKNDFKHLGFFWYTDCRDKATIESTNVTERINKFWSVIQTLVNNGIRFCHPSTILHLYSTIAVPTLLHME